MRTEQERREQFAREARDFFVDEYDHTSVRDWMRLSVMLRGFAERVTEDVLRQLSYSFRPEEIKSLVDDIKPLAPAAAPE